jgi:hypothetical protein
VFDSRREWQVPKKEIFGRQFKVIGIKDSGNFFYCYICFTDEKATENSKKGLFKDSDGNLKRIVINSDFFLTNLREHDALINSVLSIKGEKKNIRGLRYYEYDVIVEGGVEETKKEGQKKVPEPNLPPLISEQKQE